MHYYKDQINEDEIGKTCGTHGKEYGCIYSLSWKPSGKRPRCQSALRRTKKTQMRLKETEH